MIIDKELNQGLLHYASAPCIHLIEKYLPISKEKEVGMEGVKAQEIKESDIKEKENIDKEI